MIIDKLLVDDDDHTPPPPNNDEYENYYNKPSPLQSRTIGYTWVEPNLGILQGACRVTSYLIISRLHIKKYWAFATLE